MPRARRSSPSPGLTPRQWFGIGAAVVVIVGIIVLYRTVDLRAWRQQATVWNPALVVGALLVLPLIFFPVSVLQVMVGIRFGTGIGLALVFGSIVIHLLASWLLVRAFRPRFEHWLRRIRKKIPKGAHGPVSLFTLLLPGAPYAAQNYVLPVAGVPPRVYFRYALPLHAARSIVAVVFGDQSDRLTPGRIAIMAAYAVALLAVCAWTYRRLRTQLGSVSAIS